jgi:hypothetical protein
MDDVTITLTVRRTDAELVMALVGWLRYRDAEPVTIGNLTLAHPLTTDTPFIYNLPPLCEELAQAALFYVERAAAHGWKVYPTVAAFAAHEAESRADTDDVLRRLGLDA